jgi:cyclophilin family peptidyl-prolyl cis-trans isomerase
MLITLRESPWLDGRVTPIGRIVEGLEIAVALTDSSQDDKPGQNLFDARVGADTLTQGLNRKLNQEGVARVLSCGFSPGPAYRQITKPGALTP